MEPTKLYALVSGILAVQLLGLGFWTAATRAKRKTFLNPEDAALSKVDGAEAEHPDVLRAKRAHANAVENSMLFFVLGALYVATQGSKIGAQAYFFTFLGARLLHSLFYLLGKQPFRTLSFVVGALACLGMAAHVIRAALS